ncbi:Oxalate decarboxylase [Venturia inaequalis]|nr:Oxalate decarboxylase [Venturia inaequalis]
MFRVESGTDRETGPSTRTAGQQDSSAGMSPNHAALPSMDTLSWLFKVRNALFRPIVLVNNNTAAVSKDRLNNFILSSLLSYSGNLDSRDVFSARRSTGGAVIVEIRL